jgi:hypothetical protein
MANIKTYHKQYSEDKEDGVAWVSFYVNRNKINFSTGVRCCQKHWDENKCCVTSSDKRHKDKNTDCKSFNFLCKNKLLII